MKKVISLILAVMLLLSCAVTAYATDDSREFFFELTVDGGSEKKVQPGDIITVVFTLYRSDSEDSYDNGCQVQKLFLTAGELGHFHVEPGLNAKEAGHFRNPSPNGSVIHPKAFQAKGQFMPDLIGDDLAVRVLQDEADLGGLSAVVYFLQRNTVKENNTFPFSVRRKDSLQLTKHGGLSAAGRAGQHGEVARI